MDENMDNSRVSRGQNNFNELENEIDKFYLIILEKSPELVVLIEAQRVEFLRVCHVILKNVGNFETMHKLLQFFKELYDNNSFQSPNEQISAHYLLNLMTTNYLSDLIDGDNSY